MNSTLFDVRAKLPLGSTKDHVPGMLQSLLPDRFGLVVHHQSEIRPVYEMSQGNKVNLKPASEPNPPGRDQCAVESGHRACKGMTMAELTTLLSGIAQRGDGRDGSRQGLDARPAGGGYDEARWYVRFHAGLWADCGGRGGDGPLAPLVNIRDSINALGLRLQAA